MPMYTFMFNIPIEAVSQEIYPRDTEALTITQAGKETRILRTAYLTFPVLRCEECGALVAGDSYSQTKHNFFHDMAKWDGT